MPGAALFAACTVIVIIAAYYVTYFIGSRGIGMKSRSSREIKLRDRFSVSKDKTFALVEVRGRVYLVALTNGGAVLLDTYDLAEFEESATPSANRMSFRDALAAAARDSGVLPGFIASRFAARNKPDEGDAPDARDDKGDGEA
jgi:flagellar biogenesis protein FliO